jgi:MoaA/NifB/PqqE/SkfB family radical SAM enzyme
MCDIWKDTNQEELTAHELENHLVDIKKLAVQWVVFSGGEPLMHSDLFRLADLLRSVGIRVTLLSTGLLLKRFAAQIVAHVDDIILSLDGPQRIHDCIRRVPGAFAELERGIHALHALDATFPVSARCTIQRLNYPCVCETAQVASQMGLRSISFLAADLTSQAFNRFQPWEFYRQADVALTLEEVVTLDREFDRLEMEWKGTGFVRENREKLRRISRHFRVQLGLAQPEAPQCNAPWVSAVVEANGTVRPCFFHKPIGNIKTHTLFEVLNGFEAQQFRATLDVASNPTCQRCVCSLNLPKWQT